MKRLSIFIASILAACTFIIFAAPTTYPPVIGDVVVTGSDAALLGSGDATDGQVLTADGSGGAAWEAAASPTCWALDDGIWTCTGDTAVTGDNYVQGSIIIYGTTGTMAFMVPEEEGPRYACGYDVADDRVECMGAVDYSGATVTGLPAASVGSDDVADDSNWSLTTVSGALDAIKDAIQAIAFNDATVVVCPAAWQTEALRTLLCDYTDLSAAANADADNARVHVVGGSYTLASALDIDETGQSWTFDGATIDVATYGMGVTSASGTTTLRGSLFLTGTGGADIVGSGYATIFAVVLGGGVLDATGLSLDITESRTTVTETAFWAVYLEGGFQKYGLMRVHDIVASDASTVVAGIVAGNGRIIGDFDVITVNNTNATSPYAQGIQINGPHSFVGRVTVSAVTTDTGNGGTGISVAGGANYNSLTGMVWGCDSANLTDGGTGTSKTGLTSTT